LLLRQNRNKKTFFYYNFNSSYHFVLKKGAVKYVFALNTFSLTFCLIIMFLGINNILKDPDMYVNIYLIKILLLKFKNRKVYCNLPVKVGGNLLNSSYWMAISITLVIVINYIIIGIIIKCMLKTS